MIQRLIQTLIGSKNEAADDLLLQALALGSEAEQNTILHALLKRQTVHGLSGVIGQYESLSDALKQVVLANIKILHHAIRECGRSNDADQRKAALKLIALGHQGKLAYILSENLHDPDETFSKGAVDALVGLARWVSTETRRLQHGAAFRVPGPGDAAAIAPSSSNPEPHAPQEAAQAYAALTAQRPEIEQAIARAMDVHRGKHGPELLRAALLLCDSPASKTMAILHTAKHGGQSPMVRRLQQPPASEHVEAFLLGASHGQLRSHFGVVFSHIEEAPVLDALLRRTHWVKDLQLQLCVHQVSRGKWWGEAELAHDISRRDPVDAARIGEWIAISGIHDVMQDERLEQIRKYVGDNFEAKLRLLRIVLRRPRRGASVMLLKALLTDSDERIVRMAARDIVRRKTQDFENVLLQLMVSAPESVRRVVSRAIGQTGFDQFWQKFDFINRATRKQAGRAMMKVLPDSVPRLSRRLLTGPLSERLKAMQIAQELDLCDSLRPALTQLCNDVNPKLRSKAVTVLAEDPGSAGTIMDRVLQDLDPRVRANAIEVLEQNQNMQYLPLLAQRARATNSRERANAIKAMHRMKIKTATAALDMMLHDERPEHRISAMWTLKQIGWWRLLTEVGRLAKQDTNLRVRRYAVGVLRSIAEELHEKKLIEAKAG
jgi:HEAT repeat protein